MLSRRPYLIRALFEWLVDSGELPHVLVDAQVPGSDLPDAYVQDGRIVLNISPTAVQTLKLGNDEISFSARFGGTPYRVRFSPSAVIAIYGRDSGQGMMFGPEDETDRQSSSSGDTPSSGDGPAKPGKPTLTVIK